MGQSTNAQLCYGIAFDEDTEFPWHAERFDGEIEQWWRELLGYKPSFELFGEDGDYLDGTEPPKERIAEYFAERDQFDKDHPTLPVEVVEHCSGEYPMYILAVPGTSQIARRGYPRIITPANLFVMPPAIDALVAFCNAHSIEVSPPEWWLSSNWL